MTRSHINVADLATDNERQTCKRLEIKLEIISESTTVPSILLCLLNFSDLLLITPVDFISDIDFEPFLHAAFINNYNFQIEML